MKDTIFEIAADAAGKAGSNDPLVVADYLGILVVRLSGTIAGYAALYNGRYPVIGLNIRLDHVWYMFGGWHELAHILDGHVYNSILQQKGLFDLGFCSQGVDCKTIAQHEKTANLVSADICLEDGSVLDVTGYNSPSMQSYRKLKAYQDKLVHAYEQLRFSINTQKPSPVTLSRLKAYENDLRKLEERKTDLESEMLETNCFLTIPGMAAELGTTETILRYKLEAMRLRGIDIDRQELERYNHVFKNAL